MKVWAVVLAAGSGRRFGAPKQFLHVGGLRSVDRVVMAAQQVVDGTVVVLPEDEHWTGPAVEAVTAGGATRAASVRAGLAMVPDSVDVVVIHDAAHPLASPRLFSDVVDRVLAGADAAVCVRPMTEVVQVLEGGRVMQVLSKEGQVLAQSPAAFSSTVLRRAHAGRPEATEDVALVLALGAQVAAVEGDPMNVHVTTEAEWRVADRLAGLAEPFEERLEPRRCSTGPGDRQRSRTSEEL